MKKLMTLVVGTFLLGMLSITSLNAQMKCGAGKCGAAMSTPELKKPACCEKNTEGKACACPAETKCTCKDTANCTCDAPKAPKAAMKCGNGKCG